MVVFRFCSISKDLFMELEIVNWFVSIVLIGEIVQMILHGLLVKDFPESSRGLSAMHRTPQGLLNNTPYRE